MRILVADDDAATRLLLSRKLTRLGYEVVAVEDGEEAWSRFEGEAFDIVLSDWMMPNLDGLGLSQRIRSQADRGFTYILMLTSRDTPEDVFEGIDAGADGYMTKPFHGEELKARLVAAARIVKLERSLAGRIRELETALAEVKTLRGLLPICMYCHRIRDDDEAWARIEEYLRAHADVELTHGICPDCYKHQVTPMLEEYRHRQTGS